MMKKLISKGGSKNFDIRNFINVIFAKNILNKS